MNLHLEENASFDNVPEELSTLMTVLQTLRTGNFTYLLYTVYIYTYTQ